MSKYLHGTALDAASLEKSELPPEVLELGRRIATLPMNLQPELTESFAEMVEAVERRRRILDLVQESLSQLRLDIKYLMFDLEVTRGERDALQAELDCN